VIEILLLSRSWGTREDSVENAVHFEQLPILALLSGVYLVHRG
jgi:hypothetical protein